MQRLGHRSTVARGRMGLPRRVLQLNTRFLSRQRAPRPTVMLTTTPPALSLAKRKPTPSLSALPVLSDPHIDSVAHSSLHSIP